MAKSAIGQSTSAPKGEPGLSNKDLTMILGRVQTLVAQNRKSDGTDEPTIVFEYGGTAHYEDIPTRFTSIMDVQYSVMRNVITILLGE